MHIRLAIKSIFQSEMFIRCEYLDLFLIFCLFLEIFTLCIGTFLFVLLPHQLQLSLRSLKPTKAWREESVVPVEKKTLTHSVHFKCGHCHKGAPCHHRATVQVVCDKRPSLGDSARLQYDLVSRSDTTEASLAQWGGA